MSNPPQPPPGAPPPYGYVPANHPRATTILVLGILGVAACPGLGPFAWVMGRRALKEIDSSGGTIGGRGQVLTGYICGIAGTVLLALYVVWMVVFFVGEQGQGPGPGPYRVTATVPVGRGPEGVAVDPGTRTAYVTNGVDDTVVVIESR